MVTYCPADCLGNLILLHLNSGSDSRPSSRIHLAHIKEVTVFLSDIHTGIGIGQGLAPGNILDNLIFQDIFFSWILDCFFLQAIQ